MIKELRKQHNLTQSEYAKLSRVSLRNVQRYEKGEFKEPESAAELVRLKLWLCKQRNIDPKVLAKSKNQFAKIKARRAIKTLF